MNSDAEFVAALAGELPRPGFFAVVIPTHNRRTLVTRAIESVYATGWLGVEIIVVDDASKDDTVQFVASRYPSVRLLQMVSNGGPGAARNLGLGAVTAQWALMLDDDDLLRQDAFHRVYTLLTQTPHADQYPVVQFAHTNAKVTLPFQIAHLESFVLGVLSGDFAPVIQTRSFRERRLQYPDCRIGGEHLLWYEVAQTVGIPTWSTSVIELTRDAVSNLCSTATQISRPREYAELQEQTLARFGPAIFAISPAFHKKKAIGSVVYRLVAGDCGIARKTILGNAAFGPFDRLALYVLSLLPRVLVMKFFNLYRAAGR